MAVRWKSLLWLSSGLCCALASQAQQGCAAETVSAAPAAPSPRFVDNGDGTVSDRATQLTWLRCAVGQTWQGGSCTGNAARLTLEAADAQAERINRSGDFFFDDWRLPSVRELASITERRCANPRIDLGVFPGTPAAVFWTYSPRPSEQDLVYVMDFGAGGVGSALPSEQHHARFVRPGS